MKLFSIAYIDERIVLIVVMLSVIMLSVVILSVVILSVVYAECHHAECRYAECHQAECDGEHDHNLTFNLIEIEIFCFKNFEENCSSFFLFSIGFSINLFTALRFVLA
jgi:hypothetical protein